MNLTDNARLEFPPLTFIMFGRTTDPTNVVLQVFPDEHDMHEINYCELLQKRPLSINDDSN